MSYGGGGIGTCSSRRSRSARVTLNRVMHNEEKRFDEVAPDNTVHSEPPKGTIFDALRKKGQVRIANRGKLGHGIS